MKTNTIILLLFCTINVFTQQGKIFFETNYNTFSHTSLSNFQEEFKTDIAPIPVKTVDDFPANIGFTLGYEILDSNTALFLSYNSSGGKLSYSDYSGIVRLEESLNGITFGGIYYVNLNKEKQDFKIGFKGFGMYSSLNLNSYSEIGTNIQQDNIDFQSFDFGIGAQLNYEYPLSFFIIRANIGFDVVLGGKLKFKDNNEAHLINNSGEDVKTGWSGLRTGVGIAFNID
ncbi:hypothetical protein [Polaribacter aquimarinus]|uniref:Outer membrane protein beta-barrel domain-containing protein n=1 Tax=Polaribacter aquimarinus TaxID=2100726 RepID=A0A2U2J6V6_9FLAO|nr:hypothetical protein [Polaribacter aquimarinus]PWG04075.1 hypothetical protein DIS07_13980 [Polaribacter aquimarinus]